MVLTCCRVVGVGGRGTAAKTVEMAGDRRSSRGARLVISICPIIVIL